MCVNLLTEHHLEFLTLKGGCKGSSEPIHVKIPHCWVSHVKAHICTFRLKIWLLCALYIYTKSIKSLCELAWYNTYSHDMADKAYSMNTWHRDPLPQWHGPSWQALTNLIDSHLYYLNSLLIVKWCQVIFSLFILNRVSLCPTNRRKADITVKIYSPKWFKLLLSLTFLLKLKQLEANVSPVINVKIFLLLLLLQSISGSIQSEHSV